MPNKAIRMAIILTIKKAAIYDEVAKPAGYVGAKTIEDTGKAYDRVFTMLRLSQFLSIKEMII